MQSSASPLRPDVGVTLIELLVTLAIVGILGAIAYPSFMQTIYKSRRADASSALTRVQQALERWRSSHTAYTADAGDTGLNVPLVSPDGHYTLAIALPVADNGTTYEVTATAQGSQAHDTKCKILSVAMSKTGTLAYSSSDGNTVVSSSSNPCWAR